MKFGVTMHIRPPKLTSDQKFEKFKIQDGGRRPSSNSKNRDIFTTVWPILLKFCTMTHVNPPKLTSCLKIKFKKIQNGGRPPF